MVNHFRWKSHLAPDSARSEKIECFHPFIYVYIHSLPQSPELTQVPNGSYLEVNSANDSFETRVGEGFNPATQGIEVMEVSFVRSVG